MSDDKNPVKFKRRPITLSSVVGGKDEALKPAEVRAIALNGKGIRGHSPISTTTYYKAWAYYKLNQSAHFVWESLRMEGIEIGESTVQHLVASGYPNRNLQSLKERYAKYIELIDKKVDYGDIQFRAEILHAGRIAFAQIRDRIASFTDADYAKMNPSQTVKVMKELTQVMDGIGFKMGDGINTPGDAIESWTTEQKKEYLRTGQWPADQKKQQA